jgi:UDP-glucose 4-epimerase
MRIVITGATGNVGTALVRALVAAPGTHEIIGIARRRPEWQPPGVRWLPLDIARDELTAAFAGADAVVHLAWLIQPSRDRRITERVNVGGSERVFRAALGAGAQTIVHASSVAAYRPADAAVPVDEQWPTDGIAGSYYSEQKVACERLLDHLEAEHRSVRFVRLRPGLIFQRSNAAQVRRLFGGPLIPGSLVQPRFIPFVPAIEGLAGQVVHSDDIAELYRLVLEDPQARGAYNAAAQPPLDAASLGRLLGARPISVPRALARAAVGLSWRARLQPVSPDWLDIALGVPVVQTDRARSELGWEPRHTGEDVIRELLDGLRHGAGFRTPPLDPEAGGRWRLREVLTGVGGANPEDRQSAL